MIGILKNIMNDPIDMSKGKVIINGMRIINLVEIDILVIMRKMS